MKIMEMMHRKVHPNLRLVSIQMIERWASIIIVTKHMLWRVFGRTLKSRIEVIKG